MHPTPQRLFAAIALLAGLVSTGCCGPMMFHGGCTSGCGECYVDPWINEPASCCDPCDSCGNYDGQSCSSCRPVFSGIKTIWGYRYGGTGCGGCDSGCDSCGGLEVGCGLEPSCGIEGCSDCGAHGHDHMVPQGPMHHSARGFVGSPYESNAGGYGESIVEYSDPMESSRIIVPNDRRVSGRPQMGYQNRR